MPPFESAVLVEAVSDDAPAGPNLEFDANFGALERASQGKPDQQFGNTIIAAEEPDWKEVSALAVGLLERTRDLRVLVHYAVAQLRLEGLPAFADTMTMTARLLDGRWAEIHPQLDPDDDNDPTLRANALLRLAHPGLVLKFIRDIPLANSPRLGRYSWRDIGVSVGDLEADQNTAKASETLIRSAFAESVPAQVATVRSAAASAMAAAQAIVATFDDRAGPASGPDFEELIKLLTRIVRYVDRFAAVPDASPAAAEATEPEAAPNDGLAPVVRQGGRGMTAASLGDVTTRADALRLLDLVCQYYRTYEPSSPLPLLIERARRLGEKNFLDILRDLAPDGLMQAQNVVGSREE